MRRGTFAKPDRRSGGGTSPLHLDGKLRGVERRGTLYIANIARLWHSLLLAAQEGERNVFERVTMASNGRSTGWNFTPTKFNFFGSSCPRKRDRASRKDWISSLSTTRDVGEAAGVGAGRSNAVVDAVRIGPPGDRGGICAKGAWEGKRRL
ncbi:hypothetical protein X777_13808 [Ooceraea biroi]|uniref:Uncharacterized protein n=1 Tax=Ooceraea biroi TaxID=2015173 RepID=A0A026VX95_OOCBI|nr:hypothetical protein X777_13808 [Ooceraea biroi]